MTWLGVSTIQQSSYITSITLLSAQAFQDIFSDFDSWLRETERKIQRDDPLKLEAKELKQGLAYLQGISGDISAHEAAFEKVRAECCDLIGRGAGDPEELQRNLDNLQQRWNGVQVSGFRCILAVCHRLQVFSHPKYRNREKLLFLFFSFFFFFFVQGLGFFFITQLHLIHY